MSAFAWLYKKFYPEEISRCNDADEALHKIDEGERLDKLLAEEVRKVTDRARRARERNGFGKALTEALRGK